MNYYIKKWGMRILVAVVVLGTLGLGSAVILQKVLPHNVQLALVSKYPQLREMVKITKVSDWLFLADFFKESGLPIYEVEMSKKETGDLEKEPHEYVAADFKFDEKKYKIRIKNRGAEATHYQYAKKSWAIDFKKSDMFKGNIERMSLILPSDRKFLVEQLNNYRAEKLGMITPRSWFAELQVNGKSQGIFWVTEHWSAEFLALQHKVDDANLYSAEPSNTGSIESVYKNIYSYDKYVREMKSEQDNYADVERLLRIINQPDDEKFYQEIFDILDKDNFYSWNVQALLVNSIHQDAEHNLRLYFDPSRGKFEFIPWDVLIYDPRSEVDLDYNPLMTRILQNPEFMTERNRVLWDYVGDEKNSEDDLAFYDKLRAETKVAFHKDRVKYFSSLAVDNYVRTHRDFIEQTFYNLREAFDQQEVYAIFDARDKLANNKIEAIVQVGIESFGDLTLEKIEVILANENKEMEAEEWSFYYDVNGNKLWDELDIQLGKTRRENEDTLLFTDLVEVSLETERTLSDRFGGKLENYTDRESLELKITPHYFFLVNEGENKDTNEIEEMKIEFKNEITNKRFEPEVIKATFFQ